MATSGTFVMGHDMQPLEQYSAPRAEVANPMLVQPAQYNILDSSAARTYLRT